MTDPNTISKISIEIEVKRENEKIVTELNFTPIGNKIDIIFGFCEALDACEDLSNLLEDALNMLIVKHNTSKE